MKKQNEAALEALIAVQLGVIKRKLTTGQDYADEMVKLKDLLSLRNSAPAVDPNNLIAAAASVAVALLVICVERTSVLTQGALRLVTKIR